MFSEGVLEVVKNVATWVSCITGVAALVTAVVKPLRNKFAKFIVGLAHTSKLEDDTENLKQQITEFQKSVMDTLHNIQLENSEQSEKLDLCVEGNQVALGNSIKHIYYKYLPTKELPSKEWEAVVTLHAAYKQLGGNHYVDELYAEMQEWEHSA
jgi:hypothetical protein